MINIVCRDTHTWWRHQMKTLSASMAFCVGNSPVTSEFPSQRPVKRSYDVSFDLRPNKGLSKHSWCWWYETPLGPLWRHCNDMYAGHGALPSCTHHHIQYWLYENNGVGVWIVRGFVTSRLLLSLYVRLKSSEMLVSRHFESKELLFIMSYSACFQLLS